MPNYRLIKSDGTTKDLNVLNTIGLHTTSKQLQLRQAPGGNQSFVVGRNVRRVRPFSLRVLVEASTEAAARTEMAAILAFARETVTLARVDGGTIDIDASERLLAEHPIAGARPQPLHLGASDWSFMLTLCPRYPVGTQTPFVTWNDEIIEWNGNPIMWGGG